MDFLGAEGKAAAQAITNLCNKASACIDPTEIRGIVVTANQTVYHFQEIGARLVGYLDKLEGVLRK